MTTTRRPPRRAPARTTPTPPRPRTRPGPSGPSRPRSGTPVDRERRAGPPPRRPGSAGGSDSGRPARPAPGRPGNPRRRCLALLVTLLVALAAVAVRQTQLQLVSSEAYADRGVAQRRRTIVLPAERGSIFDRNGVELAMSVGQQTVWADPRTVTDPAAAAAKLAPVLGVDAEVLAGQMEGNGRFAYLARQIDDETAARVEDLDIDGVSLLEESRRFRPSGDLALSVIGEVDIDNKGSTGLEDLYDDELVGTPGSLLIERAPDGRTIAAGEHHLAPAVRGDDLVLTIDRAVQHEVERALSAKIAETGAEGGSAVVMDPRTGEILAMANMVAARDGGRSGSGDDAEGDGAATDDGAGDDGEAMGPPGVPSPHNKAVLDVFEPGSVMKVVAAAGALEEGLRDADDTWMIPKSLRVGNKTFGEDHWSSEPSTVGDVITRSSNVGTIMLAQDLGEEGLFRYLDRFGFGRPTGLGFPNESKGILNPVDSWSKVSIGTIAIGHGVSVNALQMLQAYNALANDGVMVEPSIVRATFDSEGVEHPVEAPGRRRVVSESTARELRAMLANVVASDDGTGQRARIAGYNVAGKTGTPRKPWTDRGGYEPGAYMPTFAGFVPAEDPKLSAAVVLDEPRSSYYASTTSAPLFAEITQYALRHLRIPPAPGEPLVEVPETSVPDDVHVPAD